VQWRNRAHGFLLSELGAYILTPEQAPAGTKRLSTLLRSSRWKAKLLADWLWQQADARVQALRASGAEPLLVWDGSVLEKPETLTNDDLGAVRSSKARRRKRIRPGFFNPPGGRPICVPGLHWLGLLVLGRTGAPTVAAMHWWTRRGERASDQQKELQQLLTRSVDAWGRDVRPITQRVPGSRVRQRPVAAPDARCQHSLCAALEEAPEAAGHVGRGAQSLGNHARQTFVGLPPSA
jgi:hypothetical protein